MCLSKFFWIVSVHVLNSIFVLGESRRHIAEKRAKEREARTKRAAQQIPRLIFRPKIARPVQVVTHVMWLCNGMCTAINC